MNNRETRYFNIAKEVSLMSEFDRVKIGAILVLNKDIVAVSPNLKKSHHYKQNIIWFDGAKIDS